MEPVENLNNKIKRLQKEIDKIQEKCKHKKQEMAFIDSSKLMWICKDCKKEIRWPNQQEAEEFCKK
jgi:peptidoglycan hydrolase CwlO-like protein